jgi:Tfp pilus assembly major pilin PilA
MYLKSQKGITLMSLVIYIASFLIVAGIISGITIFFYKNTTLMDTEVYSAAEYNKLNMYLVKESEEVRK